MNRKNIAIGLILTILTILAAGLLGIRQLKERSMVADVVSDEARWDVLDSLSFATQMKVVILKDGTAARFISEDEDSYTCDIQDSFTVPRNEARLEIWSAADGRGVVYLKEPGACPAYSEPDPGAAMVVNLIHEEGYVPEAYPCRGLENGWYEIEAGNSTAFIEARYVEWDAVDSF